jgi:hypothetical protein
VLRLRYVKLVFVETVQPPAKYSPRQIQRAVKIAHALNRGKLVLVEAPAR